MHNIIDTAVEAGSFKTLAAAVTAAGLVDTLNGSGPFTVYHVVAGKVMAADVMGLNGKSAKTVNGADVKISTHDGVKLNGTSTVTKTDIECTNGVIHIIDTVILPA
ncbi:MAG: fasciclin domain-containing protein [Candidatus Fonsibacter ubiquis]|nr:fasciclin domain-containing protein [Candidatus Fonsibacter ubiquis]